MNQLPKIGTRMASLNLVGGGLTQGREGRLLRGVAPDFAIRQSVPWQGPAVTGTAALLTTINLNLFRAALIWPPS